MSFVVDAPLVLARDQGDKVHHVYQGGVIAWLSEEQKQHFLSLGLVHEVDGVDSDDEDWPDESWTRADIDAFSAEQGVDTTGAANKAEALALLNAEE